MTRLDGNAIAGEPRRRSCPAADEHQSLLVSDMCSILEPHSLSRRAIPPLAARHCGKPNLRDMTFDGETRPVAPRPAVDIWQPNAPTMTSTSAI